MKEIQVKTLHNAIRLLSVLPVKYKVITEDGEEFGVLEVVKQPKRVPRNPHKKWGDLSEYAKSFIESMEVGEVVFLPCADFEPESLRSSASSWMSKTWGNGTYTTLLSKDRSTIEVLRLS